MESAVDVDVSGRVRRKSCGGRGRVDAAAAKKDAAAAKKGCGAPRLALRGAYARERRGWVQGKGGGGGQRAEAAAGLGQILPRQMDPRARVSENSGKHPKQNVAIPLVPRLKQL